MPSVAQVLRRVRGVRPRPALSGGGGGGGFGAHPRLLLTSARLSALSSKRQSSDADYVTLKDYVDTYSGTPVVTTLAGPLGTGGAGTQFTVADGSAFPSGTNFDVRCNLERMTVSRSGDTFTVVARGVGGDPFGATAVAPHASGARVYRDGLATDINGTAPGIGLMVQAGEAGYDDRGLDALSALMVFFGRPAVHEGWNEIRWYGFNVACAYDWLHHLVPADDRAAYAPALLACADYHTFTNKEGYPYPSGDQQWVGEMVMGNNISNGQTRSVLALSAAVYDEEPTTKAAHWDYAVQKFWDLIVPAFNGGALHNGIGVEGTEYSQTDWTQLADIPEVIDSAAAGSGAVAACEGWLARMVEAVVRLTLPGTTSAAASTTGTGSAGSASLEVASSSGFVVGESVYVAGFQAPVVGISGTTWTLGDPLPSAVSGGSVQRMRLLYAFGDVETYSNFQEFPVTGGEPQLALVAAQSRLAASDPTWASYAEHWLQNVCGGPASVPPGQWWKWVAYRDGSVSAADYTAALPLNYGGDDPDAMGLLLGKTSWTDPTGSQVFFHGSHGHFDHSTAVHGSFGYKRGGVYLTRHLVGYGGLGLGPSPYADYPQAPWANESAYVGAPYHNVPWMNGHGPVGPFCQLVWEGREPGSFERRKVTEAYLYGRADVSGNYRNGVGGWAAMGHANDDAQTFVRDWLWVSPDLVVYFDRLVYANATTSPTRWHTVYSGQPSVAGQRLTVTKAGQKLVHDVVLPASAVVNTDDLAAEQTGLKGWRSRVESGVSASAEYGLSVMQGMAEAGSPVAVTTLVNDSSGVAVQVGTTQVVAFLKGASPSLPFGYSYTGAPDHYVVGLAPTTAYHLTDSAGTVTVAAATGTGDTTTDAAGLLVF